MPGPSGTVSAWEVANGRQRGRRFGPVRLVAFLAVAAVLVLVLLTTVLQPAVRGVVVGWASDNPSALGIGFVHDFVREDLGATLTDPNSSDSSKVEFTVAQGDTVVGIAARLHDQGLLRDPRALVLVALDRKISDQFQVGLHVLTRNMTPDQLASALLLAPNPGVVLGFATADRLEQVTAVIAQRQATDATEPIDATAFYQEVTNPPASLLKDYPWLVIPKGGTLEGYLAAGDYQVKPDATADQLVRMMLDRFLANVGPERMKVAASRGLTWYQVLTLASIVEQEAKIPSERPLIAGVFENRLDHPTAETAGFLGSDPTVLYLNDTIQLAKLKPPQFAQYYFWGPLETPLPAELPANLAGYNTYTSKGLPPGPICTPTVGSIDAALEPDTAPGYFYFLGRKDKPTVFAKTYAEHQKNIAKYGAG